MAQRKPEERMTLDQIIPLVNKLTPEVRQQLLCRLEFQAWDEQWDQVKKQLEERHATKGLPTPTDEDIHAEFDARRSPAQLESLKCALAIGIEQADRGEVFDGDDVLQELKQRSAARLKKSPR